VTKIKICGITNLKDALLACKYGADAVGFIFAKSPRRISLRAAAQISKKIPSSVMRVGVFADQSADLINKAVKQCGLDCVQLHGDESPAFCRKIRAKVIKAFRVKNTVILSDIKKYKVDAILLDTYSSDKRGGTGKTFDWGLVSAVRKLKVPLFLSGGLNCDNLPCAIRQVKPTAVDLSSGVESSPGKKNARKMKRAIEIVKCKGII